MLPAPRPFTQRKRGTSAVMSHRHRLGRAAPGGPPRCERPQPVAAPQGRTVPARGRAICASQTHGHPSPLMSTFRRSGCRPWCLRELYDRFGAGRLGMGARGRHRPACPGPSHLGGHHCPPVDRGVGMRRRDVRSMAVPDRTSSASGSCSARAGTRRLVANRPRPPPQVVADPLDLAGCGHPRHLGHRCGAGCAGDSCVTAVPPPHATRGRAPVRSPRGLRRLPLR